jgi:APA family basic amino acid/polyamine antiporter
VVFGGTVGVGILRLPGEIARRLMGTGGAITGWILLVWVVGAVYALLGAVSLSEMAAAIPEAGGFYVYARRAFGLEAGFAMGWADWMCNCASIAYASAAAAEYLVALGGGAATRLGLRWGLTGIGLGVVAIFAGMQWFGLRVSSQVQKVTSSVTALTFAALAVACLVHGWVHGGPAAEARTVARLGVGDGPGMMVALGAVIAVLPAIVVAYDGWYEAIYFAEEDTDPARHLPRAMMGGVLCILGLYLVMNVAFLRVLPIAVLAKSQLAAADSARVVFPGVFQSWSGTFVTVLSLLTLLSLINAVLLGAPRILYAVGRAGLLRGAAEVGKGGTPRVALAATAAMSGLIVLSGRFDEIIGVAAILVAATYTVNYVAVIVLRVREPGLARPFRAWGYPWTTGAVLLASVAFLVLDVRQDFASAWRAAVLLAMAVPVYLILRRRGRS